jgi:hypothetical protein
VRSGGLEEIDKRQFQNKAVFTSMAQMKNPRSQTRISKEQFNYCSSGSPSAPGYKPSLK